MMMMMMMMMMAAVNDDYDDDDDYTMIPAAMLSIYIYHSLKLSNFVVSYNVAELCWHPMEFKICGEWFLW